MSAPFYAAQAQERYARSVQKAEMADLLGLVTGSETNLVDFNHVAGRMKARQQISRGTQMVALAKIVGSVGRYRDFTREFLPRRAVNRDRWARLDAALNALEPVPPVELYKLGEVYFVRDGNHRVSVALANGLSHIEAYVTELETSVPLTLSDFERDQWIIKTEYAGFLARTRLDELRPEQNLILTAPGNYEIILHHIEVHGYFLDREQDGAEEADGARRARHVCSWYDNVYMPVVQAVRAHGLLERFPERTEADAYLWIAKHREALAQRYGLAPLSPETAVATFAETHSDRPLERMIQGLRRSMNWALHGDEIPLGMSEDEFVRSRARHAAGELTVSEARRQQKGAEHRPGS
jgi:hypothetical protein